MPKLLKAMITVNDDTFNNFLTNWSDDGVYKHFIEQPHKKLVFKFDCRIGDLVGPLWMVLWIVSVIVVVTKWSRPRSLEMLSSLFLERFTLHQHTLWILGEHYWISDLSCCKQGTIEIHCTGLANPDFMWTQGTSIVAHPSGLFLSIKIIIRENIMFSLMLIKTGHANVLFSLARRLIGFFNSDSEH